MTTTLQRPLWPILALCALMSACADGSGGTGPGTGQPTVDMGTPSGGDSGGACNSTCDAEGAQECKAQGFRACTKTAAGCLEWTAITTCELSCVNGQCADCQNDCDEGAVRCGANGPQSCVASGDADPCFEWADATPCADGESCSNGTCAPASECQNECGKVGDQSCDGNGVRTCETSAADACLHWGAAQACAEGESCSFDHCQPVSECQDECQPDSVRCDANGVATCGNYDGDPCLEWGAAVPCADGQTCSNGACAAGCANECGGEGQRQCDGNNYQVCGNFDDDACLEWGVATACDAGQTCSNGNCRAACVNECADGTRQCTAGGVQTCGNFDEDECLEWSEAVPCDLNQTCSNGVCSALCANECGVLNARQCSGAGFQTCGNSDDDPCLEWGIEQACAAGQVCSDGQCAGRCSNECAEGSVQCAGNGFQTCGNFDEDPCLEWAVVTPCPDGQGCSNGACQVTCGNECVLGSTRCAPGGVQTCGNNDPDPCTDWGPTAPCAGDQVCSNGQCAATCSDECPAGATRCSANGVESCGNFDADACSEWGLAAPCGAGQVCSNGACAATCNDECVAGSVQCAGNGFQVCGEHDGDRCLDWGPVVPCQDGTSCSAGVCSQFCTDECAVGATRCGGGGVQSCGNFDNDNCQEWGPAIPCDAAQECANGRCAANCADECANGETRCDGPGVQSCGNYDADACREWSGNTPCGAGQICAAGACQAAVGHCGADADCAAGQICLLTLCVAPISCQQDGDCPAGERCDVVGGNVCRRDTPSGIGDPCQVDQDCPNGLTCTDAAEGGYCTLACDASAACPSGSTCYAVDPNTPDQGACLTDCAVSDACPGNQACFATGGPLGGACFLAQCRNNQDCQSNPLVQSACENGLCVQSNGCNLADGTGCAAGLECWQSGGVGVCLQGCGIFAGSPSCDPGARCVPVSVDGTGYCAAPGGGGVGAPCATTLDCQNGNFCVDDGIGNLSCRTLCNAADANACGGNGMICTALGGDVGVCIQDCQSECNAGDMRCTAQGAQSCGQGDADLCLEWLPAAACPAGQGCNDLTGACEARCGADADCANPIVPMQCVAGACKVRSECDPGTGVGCAAPEQCFLASNSGGGVCLQPCDPLASVCGNGTACVSFGASSYCLAPGAGLPGGDCATSADCSAGTACFGDATGAHCYSLCNVQTGNPGCGAAQSCVDSGVDGRLGACVNNCQDECTAGTSVCSADGTGVQTCGDFDADACLEFGPSTACTDEMRCNPNTVQCDYYCDVDAQCPVGFGVPYQCSNHQCVARSCNPGAQSCDPANRASLCVPSDPNNAAAGICLDNCDPNVDGRCGARGHCDYTGDAAGNVTFVCLPSGPGIEFADCSADNCGDGLGCLPFDNGAGGTAYYCTYYCRTAQGNADCVGFQGTVCSAVPGFPAAVGVCLPAQ